MRRLRPTLAVLVLVTCVSGPALSQADDEPGTTPSGDAEPATPADSSPAPADGPEPASAPDPPSTTGPSADPDSGASGNDTPRAGDSTRAKPTGAGGGGAATAAAFTVTMGDNFYTPKSITVDAGDTVTWSNGGQAPHSATANDGSFDTGVFNAGQSRQVTFSAPGTFNYFCTVHGQAQSGTVVVRSAPESGGDPGGGAATETDEGESTGPSLPATGAAVLGLFILGTSLLGLGTFLRRRVGDHHG